MNKTYVKDFKTVYRNEKDPRVRAHILAMHMVHVRKKSVDEIAADLLQSEK